MTRNDGRLRMRENLLLSSLTSLVSRVRARSLRASWAEMEREFWPEDRLHDHDQSDWPELQSSLAKTVDELEGFLADREYDRGPSTEIGPVAVRYIGSKFVVLEPREIHRGFLVPVREEPIVERPSLALLSFLKIEGERDTLVRENHNYGIHYHYVLANKKRTTTMICWDTRWASGDKNDAKGLHNRPVFHQLHAEGKNLKTAKPHAWGDKKRQSVRAVCLVDLKKQLVANFLCAGDQADAVWPRSSRLTPRTTIPT